MTNVIAGAIVFIVAVSALAAGLYWSIRRRALVPGSAETTYRVLRSANVMSPALRQGFESSGFDRAAPAILELVGSRAIAVVSTAELLCFEGHRNITATKRLESRRRPSLTAEAMFTTSSAGEMIALCAQ